MYFMNKIYMYTKCKSGSSSLHAINDWICFNQEVDSVLGIKITIESASFFLLVLVAFVDYKEASV